MSLADADTFLGHYRFFGVIEELKDRGAGYVQEWHLDKNMRQVLSFTLEVLMHDALTN